MIAHWLWKIKVQTIHQKLQIFQKNQRLHMTDLDQTDYVSILILAAVYDHYPSPVSVKDLIERLNKSQRFIHSQISNMVERYSLIELDRERNGTMVQGCIY